MKSSIDSKKRDQWKFDKNKLDAMKQNRKIKIIAPDNCIIQTRVFVFEIVKTMYNIYTYIYLELKRKIKRIKLRYENTKFRPFRII